MWIVFLVFPCFTNLKLHKHWIWICGRQRQLTYLLFIHVFPVQLCWKTSRTKGELNEKATRGHHDKNGCIGSRIYEEQTTGDDILKSFIAIKFLLKNKIQILSNIEEALRKKKNLKKMHVLSFQLFSLVKEIHIRYIPMMIAISRGECSSIIYLLIHRLYTRLYRYIIPEVYFQWYFSFVFLVHPTIQLNFLCIAYAMFFAKKNKFPAWVNS